MRYTSMTSEARSREPSPATENLVELAANAAHHQAQARSQPPCVDLILVYYKSLSVDTDRETFQ
jgi:hypothetical protein